MLAIGKIYIILDVVVFSSVVIMVIVYLVFYFNVTVNLVKKLFIVRTLIVYKMNKS